MNKKSQFFIMSTLLFILIVFILLSALQNQISRSNTATQRAISSSEVTYQVYNFFHVLSNILNIDFKKTIFGNETNVTLHLVIKYGTDPTSKLNTYNNFLPIYKSIIGVRLNYSLSDLISDVTSNNRYIRNFYPNNVAVTTNYFSNTITYSNNNELNYYIVNLSFNGTITGVSWTPLPAGSAVPVIIVGPNGYYSSSVINKAGTYSIQIDLLGGGKTDRLTITFNYNTGSTVIDYSQVNDISDVNLFFTTKLNNYGNVFKILSPYPNTIVNASFGDYFVSQRLE